MNLTTSTPQNSAPLTMTSREIAELTGKEHSNVTRDIREMFESLEIDAFSFEGIYLGSMNRKQDHHNFPKNLAPAQILLYNSLRLRSCV